MIKFFRKIRQNLLSEGKTGKYFKYAIGEIILVVIGILIALSINNWNQERLNENDIKNKLKLVNRELIEDITVLENEIKRRTKRHNLMFSSLKILDEETSLSAQNREVLDSTFLTYKRMDPLFNNMRSYEAFLLTESNLVDEEIYTELNNYIDAYNKTNARVDIFWKLIQQSQFDIILNSSVRKNRSGEFEYSFNTIKQEYQLYETIRHSMQNYDAIADGYSQVLKKALLLKDKIKIK